MLSILSLVSELILYSYRACRYVYSKLPLRILRCVIIFGAGTIPQAIAQTDSTGIQERTERQESLFSFGLGVQHGFIFAHSVDVENTRGARPTGIEAILG